MQYYVQLFSQDLDLKKKKSQFKKNVNTIMINSRLFCLLFYLSISYRYNDFDDFVAMDIWTSHVMILLNNDYSNRNLAWNSLLFFCLFVFPHHFLSYQVMMKKKVEKKLPLKKASAPCHSDQVLDWGCPFCLVRLSWMEEILGEAVLIRPTISHKALHSPLNCR